jgi:hypothetical protein
VSNPFDFSDRDMLPAGQPVPPPRKPPTWGFCWPTLVRLLVYLGLFLGVAGPVWAAWYFGWHRPAMLREKYEQRRLYDRYSEWLKDATTAARRGDRQDLDFCHREMRKIEHLPPVSSGYYGDQTK